LSNGFFSVITGLLGSLQGLLPDQRLFKACYLIAKSDLMWLPGSPKSVVGSHLVFRNKLGFATN
jgi:hypothetical protein